MSLELPVGTNGAGKTTTISILTGLIEASSGVAYVDGRSVRDDMTGIRENLGVCPQFDVLWPDLTVREHVELFAQIKGYSADEAQALAAASTREVGNILC